MTLAYLEIKSEGVVQTASGAQGDDRRTSRPTENTEEDNRRISRIVRKIEENSCRTSDHRRTRCHKDGSICHH